MLYREKMLDGKDVAARDGSLYYYIKFGPSLQQFMEACCLADPENMVINLPIVVRKLKTGQLYCLNEYQIKDVKLIVYDGHDSEDEDYDWGDYWSGFPDSNGCFQIFIGRAPHSVQDTWEICIDYNFATRAGIFSSTDDPLSFMQAVSQ